MMAFFVKILNTFNFLVKSTAGYSTKTVIFSMPVNYLIDIFIFFVLKFQKASKLKPYSTHYFCIPKSTNNYRKHSMNTRSPAMDR